MALLNGVVDCSDAEIGVGAEELVSSDIPTAGNAVPPCVSPACRFQEAPLLLLLLLPLLLLLLLLLFSFLSFPSFPSIHVVLVIGISPLAPFALAPVLGVPAADGQQKQKQKMGLADGSASQLDGCLQRAMPVAGAVAVAVAVALLLLLLFPADESVGQDHVAAAAAAAACAAGQ